MVARPMIDRHRLAGEHALVDAGKALFDHAVGGNLLTGLHHHQVAGRHLACRHHHLVAVPQQPGFLGTQLEQLGDRTRRPALGPRLEEAAQQDQRDDHAGRLEEDGVAGEQCPHRVEVRGEAAERDQRVHVGTEALQAAGRVAVELHAEDEHDRRGQGPLDEPLGVAVVRQHGQRHQRRREQRRQREVAELVPGLLGVPLGHRHPLLVGFDRRHVVADLAHRRLQGGDVGARVDHHACLLACEVDGGLADAGLAAEDAFDAERARGAGHPLDVEDHVLFGAGGGAGVGHQPTAPATS